MNIFLRSFRRNLSKVYQFQSNYKNNSKFNHKSGDLNWIGFITTFGILNKINFEWNKVLCNDDEKVQVKSESNKLNEVDRDKKIRNMRKMTTVIFKLSSCKIF